MCGVWGVYQRGDGPPPFAPEVSRMGRWLHHRGPDESGVYVDGPVGLGIHRLRVIDLVSGRQPMANEDGAVVAVLNGEIYNYRALRDELEQAGHRFRSQSDTEVLVHLAEQAADGMWTRLNGIFAVALWDARRRVLRLARDPFGVKPLYYADDGRRLLFASELKPLIEALDDASIDPDALGDYLAYNYVPGPRTILRQVRQVPPGHVLECGPGGLSLRPYGSLKFSAQAWPSLEACEEELLRRVDQAVRRQMVSDVPLGVLLSGGIDSSLIVASMARQAGRTIQTFSIRFREAGYDESPFARQVSRQYGTEHHEIVCEPADCRQWAPKIAWFADQLLADPSLVPTALVCREARRRVTVALSGDGGDELFAGYPTYQADVVLRWWRHMPGWGHRALAGLAHRLPPSAAKLGCSDRLRRFLDGAGQPPERAHAAWRTVFSQAERARIAAPEVRAALAVHDPFASVAAWYEPVRAGGAAPLDRFQYADLNTWLTDDVLAKVDRMSMAHALEARVPWLDPDVVALACALPPAWRMQGLRTKWLLKRAALRRLPRGIVHRQKAGFLPALSAWLSGPWRELAEDTLSPAMVTQAGWLDPGAVQRLLREHQARTADHSFKLWNLMTLVWWLGMVQDVRRSRGDERIPICMASAL